MWDEVRTVFWFEYRRHVRSRLFWRLLLAMAGVSMAMAALCALLMHWYDQPTGVGQVVVSLALGLLTVLGGVAMVAPASVVPRIFSDVYKTREMHDIYLTALHPVSIVAGRMLTASAQVGLVLLTLFPAGILICQLAGFAPSYWLVVLILTWCALLVIVSLSVRGLGKRFPADTAGALTGAPSQAVSWAFWLAVLSFVILLVNLITGGSVHLPIYLLFPLLIPYEGLARVALGGWELPLWIVALPMMAGIVALAVVAAAQWLGWWSDVAYRWQRWGGTVAFLLGYALNLALYAQATVRSPTDAERVVFWGMAVGALVYALLFAQMLGYYGMGIQPRQARYALAPPLGGVVWEWLLIGGIASLSWLVVGWVSGYWVELLRWFAWSGCMLSLLLLAQSRMAWVLFFYWLWFRHPPAARHVNRGEVRAYVESVCCQNASTMFWGLMLLFIIGWFLNWIPLPVIKTLGNWLILINPLNGLSAFTHDLGHYVRYMLYTLLLTVGFTLYGIRRGRATFVEYRTQLMHFLTN